MMPPERFFKEILINKLHAKIITAGADYHFGKNRAGDSRLLMKMCDAYGVELNVIDDMFLGEEAISSTAIRKHICGGNLKEAAKMLGREYFVSGIVGHGKALGRTIGFPTINFKAEEAKIYPPNGVYATESRLISGQKFNSITNIGRKPTVNGAEENIETHILDFSGNLYGQEVAVYFHEQIRNEKRFDNVHELGRQISKDIEAVRNYCFTD
jgi:riboflavin kinase/FMN adenylyltransferase